MKLFKLFTERNGTSNFIGSQPSEIPVRNRQETGYRTSRSGNHQCYPNRNMSDNTEFIITISKEQLGKLPSAHFNGKIKLIDKPEDVAEAVRALRKAPLIGFDTETRPSFHKGQLHSVALLQLSTENCCYLFRINILGLQSELKSILEDENVKKIGLSTHDDFHNLNRVEPIEPSGFIELQDYVAQFHIKDRSLSKIYGILFKERISKGQRLTNWEAPELSEYQQSYAALDAYACLRIYDYLMSGQFIPEESPYKMIPEPEETEPTTLE